MIRFSFICLTIFMLYMNLQGQQSVYFTHDLANYEHALELYHNQAFVAAKTYFKDVSDVAEPYSELKANAEFYTAMCSLKAGDSDAEALLENFTANYPNSNKRNDAYIETANFYFDQAQYAHSLKWFKRIRSKNLSAKAFDKYLFKYGYALFVTGDYTESKKYFIQLMDTEKYSDQAKYYYGYMAYQENDYTTAEKYLNDIEQDTEYNKNVSYYKADMFFKTGKFQEAIDAALPLVNKAHPNEKSEINKIIGESYFNLNIYEKAIPYLKEYKGKSGKWNNTDYYLLGYSYYQEKDYTHAIEQFNKIIDGKNEVAQNAYYHLAECYLKTDKKPEALNAFKNASQMDFKPGIREDAFLNYAKLSYEIGNPYEKVSDVLMDFIQTYPNNPHKDYIKELIVSSYVVSKDYEGALTFLEKEKYSTKTALYQKIAFKRGVQLYNERKFSDALKNFNKAYIVPESGEYKSRALYWNGESNYQLNNFQKAINDFKEFKTLTSSKATTEFSNVDYQLGYSYFKVKEYTKAIESFKTFTNQNSDNQEKTFDAYLRLADAYFAGSKFNDAAKNYEKAISILPEKSDYATFQAAVSYGFANKNDQKISLLQKVVSNFPKSTYRDDAYYVMGATYTTMNQEAKALEVYNKLTVEYPSSSLIPRAMLNKGLIFYNQDKFDKALTEFKSIVSKFPNTPYAQEAVQNARQIYIDTGRVDEYAAWVKNLDFVDITDAELEKDMYESAEKLYISGDYNKAIQIFKKYIETFPKGLFHLQSRYFLTQSLEKENRIDDAIVHYQYLSEQPHNEYSEESYVKLSTYFLDKKDTKKAISYLEKLEQFANHSQNIIYAQSNLMKLYYQEENFTQAVEYADKVLKSNQNDAKIKSDAQIIIARAAFITNDLDKARTSYKLVENSAFGELKAEALYFDAYFKNRDGDYKNSNLVVQKIAADFAAYKYWGAKGLVVMAKNFYALNDAYQATYILENVISNFPQYPDVVEEAESELKMIKSQQAKTNSSVIED